MAPALELHPKKGKKKLVNVLLLSIMVRRKAWIQEEYVEYLNSGRLPGSLSESLPKVEKHGNF